MYTATFNAKETALDTLGTDEADAALEKAVHLENYQIDYSYDGLNIDPEPCEVAAELYVETVAALRDNGYRCTIEELDALMRAFRADAYQWEENNWEKVEESYHSGLRDLMEGVD